jgi:hypothetical protein
MSEGGPVSDLWHWGMEKGHSREAHVVLVTDGATEP